MLCAKVPHRSSYLEIVVEFEPDRPVRNLLDSSTVWKLNLIGGECVCCCGLIEQALMTEAESVARGRRESFTFPRARHFCGQTGRLKSTRASYYCSKKK